MKQNQLNVSKLDDSFTLSVNLNLTREFFVRKKIACFLIKTAGNILGCRIEINDK